MSTLNRIPNFYLLVPVLLVLFHGKFGFSQNLNSPLTKASEFEKKTVRFVSSDANTTASANSETLPADLRQSIRDVYVWAWPLIYMSNVQKSLQLVRSPGVSGGAPVAPINNLCMLTDVVGAEFTSVPCPNRDVVYGFGLMDLASSPVVVQVPNFSKDQFWLYQVGDHRTDSFAELGSLYQTRAGFYLIVGPDWSGDVPEGVERVFRSPTNLAYILPRVLVTQATKEDTTLKSHISQIAAYPLAKYTGRWKVHDWTKRKWYPAIGETSQKRCKLVRPATFFDDLSAVLESVPPLAGEEELYKIAQRIVAKSEANPRVAEALRKIAEEIEESEIVPFFDFTNVGSPLPGYWTSVGNGAAFGVDYRTRTAVVKSNIFVNKADEAKYFYLEHAKDGRPLRGDRNYEITFAADELPPHKGLWSLTLYNQDHRLFSNPWQRHSIGSIESHLLQWNEDGSLTIFIRSKPTDIKQENWLPSPSGHFVLYLRVYAPSKSVVDGDWNPPAARESGESEISNTVDLASAPTKIGT